MKTAKLFQNGQSQAVRLPKEFRISGTQVYIKKMDNAIVLIPMKDPWETLFKSIPKFSADFMVDRNQPEQQERNFFEDS